MFLSKDEERMFDGAYGTGVEKAMKLLVKYGEAFDAERMVNVTSVHNMPLEPYKLLLEMTEGAKPNPNVLTTIHAFMSAFDPTCWKEMGISESFAEKELDLFNKRLEIYKKMQWLQIFTCVPFLVGNLPKKGDICSWIGSGLQIFCNSLLGARTNREGSTSTLASAITGKTPLTGLLETQNRYGQILVEPKGLDFKNFSNEDFGAFGYYIGALARNQNVVINGMPNLSVEQCKFLFTPQPVSGAVGLCHVVGVTPEAPIVDQAFGDNIPEERITVDKKCIEEAWEAYSTARSDKVDLVIFGCPHCSISEIRNIAVLLGNTKTARDTRLWLATADQIKLLATRMGYTGIIENAGGVFSSSCMASIPEAPFPDDIEVIATNSIKAAHYITRLTKGKIDVLYGTMKDCVASAISGKWVHLK